MESIQKEKYRLGVLIRMEKITVKMMNRFFVDVRVERLFLGDYFFFQLSSFSGEWEFVKWTEDFDDSVLVFEDQYDIVDKTRFWDQCSMYYDELVSELINNENTEVNLRLIKKVLADKWINKD